MMMMMMTVVIDHVFINKTWEKEYVFITFREIQNSETVELQIDLTSLQ
jgi:hypothetical protein